MKIKALFGGAFENPVNHSDMFSLEIQSSKEADKELGYSKGVVTIQQFNSAGSMDNIQKKPCQSVY